MKQRNNAFDLLCGLCILRMVTLHVVCQTQMRQTPWWKETMAWTFFFMSFFFFKAGYFNKGITGKTIPYLRDRIQRLLTPYISWGIIGGIIAFCWLCLFPEGPANAIAALSKFRWLVGGLTFGNGPLWFLLSFFTTYVLMHFIERVRYLHWMVLLFPTIGYWLYLHGNPLWFYLSNVFCGTFFFYMGKAWHHVLDKLTRHTALSISLLLCTAFVMANIFLHSEYEMKMNLWLGDFWKVLLIMSLSLLGISGVLLSLPTPRVPLVNYVGEHSMVFFVMHYPIVLSYAYASILLGHNIKGSFPDLFIILILAFTLCFLAVPFVERVPWLSGRRAPSPSNIREGRRTADDSPLPEEGAGMRIYFYHTQDTERIVREWKEGVFPSHFLYGAIQLKDYGIDVVWHHQKHTYKRLRDMIVATWKVLSCRKPYDILYATHTLGIEPVILLRALRLYRHPIVVWHHQPIVKAKNPLREALERLFYQGIDHMIFFSRKLMQDSLLSDKADPKRMSMVHWGADLDYYDGLLQSLRQALSQDGDEKRAPSLVEAKVEAAFISTGKELRDFETLIKAFHETGLPLVLYAEKKRKAYFETLHPAKNIELHYGDRPIPHEIAQEVAKSRCVCICCQKSNYTVGLTTVVEALALGLPILCTRNPQMPMDIEAEGCGFWLEPGDVEGWKEKLRYIAHHTEEAKTMGRRGRALAEQLYNVRQCGKEVANILMNYE
jgi:glycosyltransferase involved in cell wall biosynthesis